MTWLVVFQMNLQDGCYGDKRYLRPGVVQQFAQKRFRNNYKGLDWDKPDKCNIQPSYVSAYASADTYGHSGFTRTVAWVYPQYDLLYIFLSNRSYPNASNKRLNQKIYGLAYTIWCTKLWKLGARDKGYALASARGRLFSHNSVTNISVHKAKMLIFVVY